MDHCWGQGIHHARGRRSVSLTPGGLGGEGQVRTTMDATWRRATDTLSTTEATSFLGLTVGIANNDNTEDDRAKEEMGGGGILR